MLKLETRRSRTRQAVAAFMGYLLALHLIVAGLAGAGQAIQGLSPLARLDPDALCLSGATSPRPDWGRWGPVDTHHQDLRCTLACGVARLAPTTAFAIIVYAAAA